MKQTYLHVQKRRTESWNTHTYTSTETYRKLKHAYAPVKRDRQNAEQRIRTRTRRRTKPETHIYTHVQGDVQKAERRIERDVQVGETGIRTLTKKQTLIKFQTCPASRIRIQ